MKHRCGGELQPQKIKVKKKIGFYYQTFTVDGHKCDYCGDEIISRDTAFAIDEAVKQLRKVWSDWRVPSQTKVTYTSRQETIRANSYVNS